MPPSLLGFGLGNGMENARLGLPLTGAWGAAGDHIRHEFAQAGAPRTRGCPPPTLTVPSSALRPQPLRPPPSRVSPIHKPAGGQHGVRGGCRRRRRPPATLCASAPGAMPAGRRPPGAGSRRGGGAPALRCPGRRHRQRGHLAALLGARHRQRPGATRAPAVGGARGRHAGRNAHAGSRGLA